MGQKRQYKIDAAAHARQSKQNKFSTISESSPSPSPSTPEQPETTMFPPDKETCCWDGTVNYEMSDESDVFITTDEEASKDEAEVQVEEMTVEDQHRRANAELEEVC